MNKYEKLLKTLIHTNPQIQVTFLVAQVGFVALGCTDELLFAAKEFIESNEFVDDDDLPSIEIAPEYHSYFEAYQHMEEQGVKHLGWANSGLRIPDYDWKDVYHNLSGSDCLYVDQLRRVSYSVNMGDSLLKLNSMKQNEKNPYYPEEESPQSFFIVLPAIQIWTDEEHVHESTIHYPNYEMALANAKVFSRRYDCEFYILEAKSIVKTIADITSLD